VDHCSEESALQPVPCSEECSRRDAAGVGTGTTPRYEMGSYFVSGSEKPSHGLCLYEM
jgi:hypothetical protein